MHNRDARGRPWYWVGVVAARASAEICTKPHSPRDTHSTSPILLNVPRASAPQSESHVARPLRLATEVSSWGVDLLQNAFGPPPWLLCLCLRASLHARSHAHVPIRERERKRCLCVSESSTYIESVGASELTPPRAAAQSLILGGALGHDELERGEEGELGLAQPLPVGWRPGDVMGEPGEPGEMQPAE